MLAEGGVDSALPLVATPVLVLCGEWGSCLAKARSKIDPEDEAVEPGAGESGMAHKDEPAPLLFVLPKKTPPF